jgi:peroxiredoxin
METAKHVVKVGDVIPDIALPSIDGRTIQFREYRGRRLFVFMWASW